MTTPLKKDQVLELYAKYRSKRKVAKELNVSRQYVIQVIQQHEIKNKSV
jgi:DNA invertase Pin-like site-specific DNA recombinase